MKNSAVMAAVGGVGIVGVALIAALNGAFDRKTDTGTETPPQQAALAVPDPKPEAGAETATVAAPETAAVPEPVALSDVPARSGAAPVLPETPGLLSAPQIGTNDVVQPGTNDTAPGRVPPAALTAGAGSGEVAGFETTGAPRPQAETEAAALAGPSFDLVRAEPGGSTLVAGLAAPGAQVAVLVNGARLAETQAGLDGRFVLFLDIDASERAQVLTLLQKAEGAEDEVASEEEVIITPAVARVATQDTGAGAPQTAVAAREPDAEDLAGTDAAPSAAMGDAGDTEGAEAATASAAPETPAAARTPGSAEPETTAGEADDAPATAMAVADGSAGPETPSDMETTEAPSVLRASASGIEVMQTAPLAPGDVALDAISYDDRGAVLISGRGSEDSFIRVYLDNAPLTTSQIEADGRWRIQLPQVDTGTYTLRVDQVDAGGTVTARVESPFLRESPETLAAAAEAGPITAITVQPGHTLWAIAKGRYGEGIEYVKVYKANADRIRDPDLIYPGQIFDLPTE
ncbi:LysM peptidoglycan-binding domain-containing protein [Tropicibacter sp. S64]|uniref:LysM peptidoglycan-binding domain-containing protein n=1 Tax=Tropicibacter sp. S64 TaxID=3415122 RepID=UPI003C7DCC7C